jgi:hypothetical protein
MPDKSGNYKKGVSYPDFIRVFEAWLEPKARLDLSAEQTLQTLS